MQLRRPHASRLIGLLFATILVALALPLLARDIQVPASRSLEVKQVRGTVTYQGRPAKVGDRLSASGSAIATGKASSAVLAVDNGIATVNISENSTLQVKNLSITSNGGRITQLSVPKGQARVQARRLTNSASRLELSSPVGVAGVRGTVFGIGVGPNGKTGISTLEGAVAVTAKGKTVSLARGYSSLVFPGDPPTRPQPNQENLKYVLESLSKVANNQVRVICQVDPLNVVFMNDQPLEMNREGKINVVLPLPKDSRLKLVIRTPLGKEQSYDLKGKWLKQKK